MHTGIAVSVAAVGLGVEPDHVGDVRAFDVDAVEHLLPEVVELVGVDVSLDPDLVVVGLAQQAVGHLGEPPDAVLVPGVLDCEEGEAHRRIDLKYRDKQSYFISGKYNNTLLHILPYWYL
jgi:hypothetical protein